MSLTDSEIDVIVDDLMDKVSSYSTVRSAGSLDYYAIKKDVHDYYENLLQGLGFPREELKRIDAVFGRKFLRYSWNKSRDMRREIARMKLGKLKDLVRGGHH